MNAFISSKQMAGMSKEAQAKRAILHMLRCIESDPHVGWYCGYGTQSFSLLTEAYATLVERNISDVREAFMPENPKDPQEKI